MKKNAVLLWVVYFLNLMVFPVFFIRYTSSGPSVDTNAYLILQLVSTVIGVALFREKDVYKRQGMSSERRVRIPSTE